MRKLPHSFLVTNENCLAHAVQQQLISFDCKSASVALAITSTVAAAHTTHLLRAGHALGGALTSGFHIAFLVSAGFAAAGALIALAMVRGEDSRAIQATPAIETT